MSRIDYIDRGEFEDLMRRLRALETASPLEHSAVSNGRLRFIGGLLLMEANSRLTVIGHVNGEGDFVWDGPWALKGDGEITGDVGVTGSIEILDEGVIKVGNVLIEDGKISAGNVTIDPDVDGGVVDFGGGRRVHAASGFLGVYDGDNFVVFNSSGITLYAGDRSVTVGAAGVRFSNLPTKTAATTGKAPNDAVFDDSGFLFRVT
jgi:hypothetical protein